MKTVQPQSLWRWICLRILALAIGSVAIIALCMWSRFAIVNIWVRHHMPPALQQEFEQLVQHPETDLPRFHQIVDHWWGVRYSDPSINLADWLTVGMLVVVMIPFIVLLGLRSARPLSVQFSRLAAAARAVSRSDFYTEVRLVDNAPIEVVRFTDNFNTMVQQLARYERELHASHVAMAHELRSPLTAAIGRLQGMLDGVFQPQPHQLEMVMKQLQLLNRLINELHLLSLADAGQLSLNVGDFDLAELLQERIAWLKPQSHAAGMTITISADCPCVYCGDIARLGQVFTVVMENALRYAAQGGLLTVAVAAVPTGWQIVFRDRGAGVPVDFLPVMFERFTRAESSRAAHSGGSGLGLSIARAICEAHGGSISAALSDKGGLITTIFLPVRHV